MIPNAILPQIAANIRAVGRQERQVITQTHFEIYISSGALDWLSYATALSAAQPSRPEALAQMTAVFAHYGKRPRLEFVADLHPDLGPTLEQAGFVCESRAPLMALTMAHLSPPPHQPPPGRYQRLADVDEPFLRAYLTNQSNAYGGSSDENALDWLPNLQKGLADGRVLGAALVQGNEIVSGAVIQTGAGIGELAGVWSAPHRRGRGLAYALCQHLLAEYAAAGFADCWLSAAEGAQRLYEKLGFTYVGVQLNYGMPKPTQA